MDAFMHLEDFTFEELIRYGRGIRFHPNGFIQIDLPELGTNSRVHVWHPDIKMDQVTQSTGVHDHIYGFHSLILRGDMTHVTYVVRENPEGRFRVWEQVKTELEDARLEPDGKNYELETTDYNTRNYRAGQTYWIAPRAFHTVSVAGFCATIITTTARPHTGNARVVFHQNRSPIKGFSRYQYEATDLWNAVEEVLG